MQKTRGGTGPTRGRAAAAPRVAGSARWLPNLKGQDGCGAMLLVAEQVGDEWDEIVRVCEVGLSAQASKGRGRGAAVGRLRRISPGTCRALAALGNDQRAKIMAKLLEGPATYRALKRLTRLKAGPLYHHINHLRLAGLILPKQRDLYELTRGGRNLILGAMVVGPVSRDSRRRPQTRGG